MRSIPRRYSKFGTNTNTLSGLPMSIFSFVQDQDSSRFVVGDTTLDAATVAGYMTLLKDGKRIYTTPSRFSGQAEPNEQMEFPNLGEFALAQELLVEYNLTAKGVTTLNADLTYRIIPYFITRPHNKVFSGFQIVWVEEAKSNSEVRNNLISIAEESTLHLNTDYDYHYVRITFPVPGMYSLSEIDNIITTIYGEDFSYTVVK